MAQKFSTCFLVFIFLSSCISLVKCGILESSASVSTEYDFVIVGGGTAGNVIANRLTEDPNVQVLVIEAGGSDEVILDAQIPFLWPNLAGSSYDWNFTTTPQTGLDGRSTSYTRGHVLGGSSTINGMGYTRGSAEDYDMIARLTGDDGWSWDQLQPYIRKNERFSRPADNHTTTGQFNSSVHGFDGITEVTLPGFPRPIDQRVLQAVQESSEFSFNLDANSGNQLGFSWLQATITSNGRRDSSATSYLGPNFINRPNLHVLLNNQVTRLLPVNSSEPNSTITFNIVEFIEVINGVSGVNRTVTAKREIILSAGCIGTPHILLHSGIGDREALSALGITPIHHLPGVGQNLTDHAIASNAWFVNSTDTFETVLRNATLLEEHLEEWKRTGTGYLVDTSDNQLGLLRLPANASIFERSADPSPGPHTAHIELSISNGLITSVPPPTGNFISIGLIALTPLSRGSVTLSSSNPLDHPLINPGTLVHEFDRFTMREAARSAQRFLDLPAWDGYVLEPFGDLASIDLQSDEQLDEYIRANTVPGLHGVSTAAMSPKGASWGVTDPDLRVKGIYGIRIVDASVIPFIPSAHTQAPIYIISERAADIIKEAWKNLAQ